MIVEPKMRGFICTTAHPEGLRKLVEQNAAVIKKENLPQKVKNVLVIGASTGYGLACRLVATVGLGADTIGVSFDRPPSNTRTGTAGYYNNLAFEQLARNEQRQYKTIVGDAFSTAVKAETVKAIKNTLSGSLDLVIYSLAAPKRTDHEGETFKSVIQPIGQAFTSKTVNFHTGEVTSVTIPPATKEEIEGTVKVMGGEDWLLWLDLLMKENLLAENVATVAFSYIGPSLTHPIYKDGTIGQAKKDLDLKAAEINKLVAPLKGKAFVSVNKALVTQASSAIPVVPLYISILYKLMKEQGNHEDCTQQGIRLFKRLYRGSKGDWGAVETDRDGRLHLDDWEMEDSLQKEVMRRWEIVSSENLKDLGDLEGYNKDFYQLFGFQVEGIDYDQSVEVNLESF